MRYLIRILILCLAALAALPAVAAASPGQLALFQDDRQLLQRDEPPTRRY